MRITEMRMSRWICGHTKLDRIRNEVIRGKIRVASVEDKIREVITFAWSYKRKEYGCTSEKM